MTSAAITASGRAGRLLAALIAGALALAVAAGPAFAAKPRTATPVMQPPITVDGPNSAIMGLSGLAVSRDGTGGLVYLESVGGVPHVFVSALAGGAFAPPTEIDSGFGSPSSQPVITAGDGGLLLIAFINGGELYVVSRPDTGTGFSAPQGIFSGAINPSIDLSIHSVGYLAFDAGDGGGWDVRNAYYSAGQWQLDPTPLGVNPGDDAGTGTGAPVVTAAGDSEAIVAWGEAGHIYARRVWFAMASPVVSQADPASMSGLNEVDATAPQVAAGDNSSYTDVAFRESFSGGSGTFTRVLVNRMVGSSFGNAAQADGQAFTGAAATDPGMTMMQYGNGFVTSELQGSNQVWADLLGQNGVPGPSQQIDSLPNNTAPYPTSAIAGDYTGLIAWQHDPGGLSAPEIRARFYTNSAFGPELVASDPSLGSTNAAAGLFAAGDHGGDVAIAYVQGTGPATRIEVAELVYPPGSFSVPSAPRYRTSATPTLTWSAPRELWGPTSYSVTIDGAAAGTTSGASFTPTAPLAQGPHTVVVTAFNSHGLSSPASPARFFVDSLPPTGQVTLSGKQRIGDVVRLRVRYTDVGPSVPAADASGVATVFVAWGEQANAQARIRETTASHRYLRAGRYRIKVTITDRAGNRTVLTRQIRIQSESKSHKKKKK